MNGSVKISANMRHRWKKSNFDKVGRLKRLTNGILGRFRPIFIIWAVIFDRPFFMFMHL